MNHWGPTQTHRCSFLHAIFRPSLIGQLTELNTHHTDIRVISQTCLTQDWEVLEGDINEMEDLNASNNAITHDVQTYKQHLHTKL